MIFLRIALWQQPTILRTEFCGGKSGCGTVCGREKIPRELESEKKETLARAWFSVWGISYKTDTGEFGPFTKNKILLFGVRRISFCTFFYKGPIFFQIMLVRVACGLLLGSALIWISAASAESKIDAHATGNSVDPKDKARACELTIYFTWYEWPQSDFPVSFQSIFSRLSGNRHCQQIFLL